MEELFLYFALKITSLATVFINMFILLSLAREGKTKT